MKGIQSLFGFFFVFSELLNRGFILDLILKLVGAKIICQQLYDQTE